MTKSDLTNAIAAETGLSKAQAADAIKATIDAISNALQSGDRVSLVGFGTFSVTVRPARKGFNPRTGEAIDIPESKAVKFKAGKELADSLKLFIP